MSATKPTVAGVVAVLAATLVTTGSAGRKATTTADACALPHGAERIAIDPADFTTRIDNPWWPMKPGSRWVYRETTPDGPAQRVVVTVTTRTKLIANGVRARVVHDAVTAEGMPVEITDDWYAQDRCGNVWYLGEDTKEYEDGKVVSTEGSFEAGVDGAQPGVIVPAKPMPGMRYRQEYWAGHAEDRGEVFSLTERAEVPFGYFRKGRVLMTRDLNPLEPKVLEYKFYARGIGPVLAIGVSGGSDREELVRYESG
jgi:hypothetical protein